MLFDKAAETQAGIQSAYPILRPIAALKARIWIRQGKFDVVAGWVQEAELSIDDTLSFVREFEHLTLARFLLAQYRQRRSSEMIQLAHDFLTRLLQAAEAGNRGGSVIEILLLQALAYEMQAKREQAVAAFEQALLLAEPQGSITLFVDEGQSLLPLLQAVADRGSAVAFVRRLQRAIGQRGGQTAVLQSLPDPLSERELEVLQLLGSELSGPQIAQRLVISLNTLRTHTKNIYSKLGVNSRRTAVRRAQELALF